MIHLNSITRLEVIDPTGRVFGRFDLDGLELSGQDDGRTLKIFLVNEGETDNTTITLLYALIGILTHQENRRELAVEYIRDHLKELGLEKQEESDE